MEVVALICPVCAGPFQSGIEFCGYCGCGLLYKEEIVLDNIKSTVTEFRRKRLLLNGAVMHELRRRTYMGCPKCYRKLGARRCEHYDLEPVKHMWASYLVADNKDTYVIESSPMVGLLDIGKIYTFDVLEKENGEYFLTAIDEQAMLRAKLERKGDLVKSLASKGYSLADIKKAIENV